MATSGSTDFGMDSRQIITAAFTNAKIYAAGETITADDMRQGQESLNLMLKTWSAIPHLWIKTEGAIILAAGQSAYSVPAARRVHSVRRRVYGLDTPLNELAREEYYDLPNKAGTGMPVSWYFDPQRSSRTIHVWLVPDVMIAAQASLHFTYSRVIEDIDALENDPDVPQEWLEALVYSLADRLADSYGAANDRLTTTARSLMSALEGQDQEQASIYIQPAHRY